MSSELKGRVVQKLKSIWDEDSVLTEWQGLGIKLNHFKKVQMKLFHDYINGDLSRLEDFVSPPNMTKKLDEFMQSGEFTLFTTSVAKREDSSDGTTTKLLIKLPTSHQVESVLMRYNERDAADYAFKEDREDMESAHRRVTLCVSSQIGCAMGCTFCATGTMGIIGNLTSGEIMEQFVHASKIDHVRNIVFMGMGEPMNNYEAVLSAIRSLTDGVRFALKRTRVQLSTVGVIPKILKMTDEDPYVTLALSLHAPTQEMREKIVPSAKTYKLNELMEAIEYHIKRTGRRVMLEYCMLGDVNCGEDTAHLLGKLIKGRNVHLNLIPFNPVDTLAKHQQPDPDVVKKFASILKEDYSVFTTVRREFGQDISGACGQLAVEVTGPRKKLKQVDIEDLVDDGKEKMASVKREKTGLQTLRARHPNNATATAPTDDTPAAQVLPPSSSSSILSSSPSTSSVSSFSVFASSLRYLPASTIPAAPPSLAETLLAAAGPLGGPSAGKPGHHPLAPRTPPFLRIPPSVTWMLTSLILAVWAFFAFVNVPRPAST